MTVLASALPVPAACLLDPDGELLGHATAHHVTWPLRQWVCHHSRLRRWRDAAGTDRWSDWSPYAVMVAEPRFASGCRFLVNLSSASRIGRTVPSLYFVLINRALRDEGPGAYDMPPADEVAVDPVLVAAVVRVLHAGTGSSSLVGGSRTTDAPFRGIELAVERPPVGRIGSGKEGRRPTRSSGRADATCCAWPTLPTGLGNPAPSTRTASPAPLH